MKNALTTAAQKRYTALVELVANELVGIAIQAETENTEESRRAGNGTEGFGLLENIRTHLNGAIVLFGESVRFAAVTVLTEAANS